MKNSKEFLLTDTVGFIQKLPTTLVRCFHFIWWISHRHFPLLPQWNLLLLQVAAFRATLEEITESSLLVHVVDIR